jgi:hypothetical protein
VWAHGFHSRTQCFLDLLVTTNLSVPSFLLFCEMASSHWLTLCYYSTSKKTLRYYSYLNGYSRGDEEGESTRPRSAPQPCVSSFFLRSTLRTFYYLGAAPCVFADPSGLVPPLAEAAIYGVQRLISACSDLKGLDCFFATNYRVFLFRDWSRPAPGREMWKGLIAFSRPTVGCFLLESRV